MGNTDGEVLPRHGEVVIGIDEVPVEVPDAYGAHRGGTGAVVSKVILEAFLVQVGEGEGREDRRVVRIHPVVQTDVADRGGRLVLRDHHHPVVAVVEVPVLDGLRDVPVDAGMGSIDLVLFRDRLAVGSDGAVFPLEAVPGHVGDIDAFRQGIEVDRHRAEVALPQGAVIPAEETEPRVDDGLGFREGREAVHFKDCPAVLVAPLPADGHLGSNGGVWVRGVTGGTGESACSADEIHKGGINGDREGSLFRIEPFGG